MRSRSLLTILFFCFTALGLAGCGSSNNDVYGGEFVNTNPAAPITIGGLTFNFETPDPDDQQWLPTAGFFQLTGAEAAPIASLRFQLFENVGGIGQPAVTTSSPFVLDDFQESINITGLSTSLQSVRITALDAQGIPLFTITQAVTIEGGELTPVAPIGEPVAITLQELQVVSSPLTFAPLSNLELEVGGTAQIYIAARFSDGTQANVSGAATFANDSTNPDSSNILEVGEQGQLRGISEGQTVVEVGFQGQTLVVPVSVVDAMSVTFSQILIDSETGQLTIAPGANQTLAIFGARASDGFVFGISNDSPNLTLTLEDAATGITLSNGVVSVSETATPGTSALVRASYLNANGSVAEDTIFVVVDGTTP